MKHRQPRKAVRNIAAGDLRSVRVPAALARQADARAHTLGCTFTDIVVESLAAFLGAPRNARVALLAAVAQHVSQEYQSHSFPDDVTRLVFLHIRDTPELRALYDEAVAVNDDAKSTVNQSVGRLVAFALSAHPDERRRCGPGELIESYAVLVRVPF